MKFRTTKKEINSGFEYIIPVRYCDLQFLLSLEDPVAYTAGIDGWDTDIYDYGNTAIVTGYKPFGNVKADYDIVRRYDDHGKQILDDDILSYSDKKELLHRLINEFISEVTKR